MLVVLAIQLNRLIFTPLLDHLGAGFKRWREKRAAILQRTRERLQDSIAFTHFCTVGLYITLFGGLILFALYIVLFRLVLQNYNSYGLWECLYSVCGAPSTIPLQFLVSLLTGIYTYHVVFFIRFVHSVKKHHDDEIDQTPEV